MEKINSLFKEYKTKKSHVTKSFQSIGIEYVEKLGGTRKDYGRIFKAIKEHPTISNQAFSYSVDAHHPNRIQLFFWRYNELLKGNF